MVCLSLVVDYVLAVFLRHELSPDVTRCLTSFAHLSHNTDSEMPLSTCHVSARKSLGLSLSGVRLQLLAVIAGTSAITVDASALRFATLAPSLLNTTGPNVVQR